MSAGDERLVCAPGLRWVADVDRVIVVDELRGEAHILQGAEAAVWSWLSLGHAFPDLARLLSASLGIAPADAERRLAVVLRGWQAAGLLAAAEPEYG